MAIDQQLSKNRQWSDKIQKLTGMPAQQACDGFKNLGQWVAAAHVSKNPGISFACMKSDGTSATELVNLPNRHSHEVDELGKDNPDSRPECESQTETNKDMKQTNLDLKNSSNSSPIKKTGTS